MSVFDVDDDQSSWYFRAACRGRDPQPWEAEASRPDYEALKAEAKRICQRCPVRDRCLSEHLTEKYGIWGGMTANERSSLRGRRRRAA